MGSIKIDIALRQWQQVFLWVERRDGLACYQAVGQRHQHGQRYHMGAPRHVGREGHRCARQRRRGRHRVLKALRPVRGASLHSGQSDDFGSVQVQVSQLVCLLAVNSC
jgi:hypothetical protein